MLKLITSTVRCLIDNEFYNKYYNVHNVHILTMLNLIISTVRCLIDNGFYIMYIHMISYNIHEGRRPPEGFIWRKANVRGI